MTISGIGRALLICVLTLATLGFGLAGLCGAVFTITTLPDVFTMLITGNFDGFFTKRAPSGGIRFGVGSTLEISVPSLLIGTGVAWWCGRRIRKWLNK
ncbi:hypothetical protein [Roseateles sp. P5_E7]